ncbi:putative transcription factor & chromatin remodeling DDT family [Rosa chinensis]|uniref:Putative transcription factor & chromatin remodeling DDT family n=1 Tax=Rosa chinensis TaxID=74649 RepID=A0A2P6Q498_ROSCH|nr:homeobox-DDT domain protein RLT1 isoform X1 [Rosa chinensis]PRQ29011.1 putative transcription factor & chromatin remodeling DDT family [Rosa chinensis]
MEGSEGDNQNRNPENSNSKLNNSGEGGKPKRQMKTPFQLETLEKAYALETYPSESIRAELSEKLGLSDRQLQMWFCHRRLKDKKEGGSGSGPGPGPGPAKKQRKSVAVLPEPPIDDLAHGSEPGSDYGSGSGSGSSPFGHADRNVVSRSVVVEDMPRRRHYESQQSITELRAIAIVEAQLGEPLREDGPVLGIEFDQLPPDAFGAPLVAEQQKRHDAKLNKGTPRSLHEYPYLQDHPIIRPDVYGQVAQSHFHDSAIDGPTARASPFASGNEQLSRVHGGHSRARLLSQQEKQAVAFSSPGDDGLPLRDPFINVRMNTQYGEPPIIAPENSNVLSDGQINDTMLRMERKRKSEEVRMAKEVEAHEVRIRKELEKQDILRRKNEERMKKEMERQDRERRKEEERLMRERQREEERSKKEQKREIERREKFLQKEHIRAEKRRQKEELRKEREEVRRKAALEKATARRLLNKSMELYEDEQLELMELAAASKGLSSIISIDPDTNLDEFRDDLTAFPPKSVLLKKPFAVHPWIDSEENIGNFLMVWRFLITFADVLELWPFTVDEFVQAFHDYDSRLLGEIHVALLRLIIKDIEDVARTPSTGLGLNQNGAANPGGGHPQIVEGAYAWGFDIRNWQKHLNLLTWPEIFRQLALSAGFGPQLKKRSISWSYLPDNDEGKGCRDVISTLRNGSAAENAFAIMQEKGLLAPRRSRHRLTPGTVKFAAFHVLSLEGNKGLTVLELADKIQKSGLRDLTTSKTPEASISVALTRDTKLFERIAPSTYRVRSAYRKDPIDAEAILSAARKKVQIFENGILAAEDVDEVERDDAEEVERDEDSDCDDVDEDPEVDDLATPAIVKKSPDQFNEVTPFSENGQENLCIDVAPTVQNEFDKDVSSFPVTASKEADGPSASSKQCVSGVEISTSNLDQENMEIDESKAGESWVQGLTEGDYSDLSVEERLSSLVSLIGIANEGNSIRVVLEDRLEAANALKKQMWAEAQLDKSRLKEENVSKVDIPSFMGGKAEAHVPGVEDGQSPLLDVYNRINEEGAAETQNSNHGSQVLLNGVPVERAMVPQDTSMGPENILNQQLAYASKKSRSQLKSYIAHRAEEMYAYRSLPLGQDRRHNRYWQFVASASSNDPGSGRIFIELNNGNWRLIDTEEAFDTLLMSLDTRGIRESHLRLMLQKIEASFKENVRRNLHPSSRNHVKKEADEMDSSPDYPSGFDSPGSTVSALNTDVGETSSSFRIELNRNENEKRAALSRYQDFQKWMWRECFSTSALCASKYGKKRCRQLFDFCDFCLSCYHFEDSHCSFCHQTFGATYENLDFSEHVIQCKERRNLETCDIHVPGTSVPLASKLLKAFMALVEVSVPPEALQSFWTEDSRKTWGAKLNASSSVEELLQMLTVFETAMKRDFVSSNFAATDELLGSSKQSVIANRDYLDTKSVSVLPWIPHTTAAVALRVYEMDSAITYIPNEKPEPNGDKEVGEHIKIPLRFTPMRNDREIEPTETDHNEQSTHLKSARNSLKRGRGGREQGRGKKSKSGGSRRKARGNENENMSQGLGPVGRRTQGQGSGRGRRTVRKRRMKNRAVEGTLMGHVTDLRSSPDSGGESPRNLAGEWDDENINMIHMKGDEQREEYEQAEALESDDEEQAVGYEQGNWEIGFDGTSSGWNSGLREPSDEEMDASEDDNNGIEEAREEDSEGDVDLSDASDEVPNRIINDGGTDSASDDDDYSD